MTSGKKEQGEELRDVVCSLLNKVRKGGHGHVYLLTFNLKKWKYKP